jgi:hypothetical protein
VTGLTDEGEISSSEVFVTDQWGQLRPGAPISSRHRDVLAAYGYTPEAHSVFDGELV